LCCPFSAWLTTFPRSTPNHYTWCLPTPPASSATWALLTALRTPQTVKSGACPPLSYLPLTIFITELRSSLRREMNGTDQVRAQPAQNLHTFF
jgi:hypothetical protein